MKKLKEKISPNPTPKDFNQHEMAGTKEKYLGTNALDHILLLEIGIRNYILHKPEST